MPNSDSITVVEDPALNKVAEDLRGAILEFEATLAARYHTVVELAIGDGYRLAFKRVDHAWGIFAQASGCFGWKPLLNEPLKVRAMAVLHFEKLAEELETHQRVFADDVAKSVQICRALTARIQHG